MTTPRMLPSNCAENSNIDIDISINNTPPSALTIKSNEETNTEAKTKHGSPTLSLNNAGTLHGRPKAATLPSGQKITPAALVLLHQSGAQQCMLAKNWFKRLGFVPIIIPRMSSDQAIKEIETLHIPHHHEIQVVLFELNYSDVGGKEPNYALIETLTTTKKIKPQFLVGCSFTPECINNLKQNEQYKDKVKAIQFQFLELEEAVKKSDQPRKHSYSPQ